MATVNRLAPKGIPWEQWRKSKNVEDTTGGFGPEDIALFREQGMAKLKDLMEYHGKDSPIVQKLMQEMREADMLKYEPDHTDMNAQPAGRRTSTKSKNRKGLNEK